MSIQVTAAPGAAPAVRFAAAELRRYLARMLPAGDAVFALVCEAGAPDAAPDAWRVETTPAGGTLTGNRPRAVLLGVYDYLHALGCRFLAPGAANERVPAIGADALGRRYEKTAAFRHRGVCIEGADSRENLLDFIDWLPKIGFNSFFLQFRTPWAFLDRWYRHANNAALAPEPFTAADAERVMAEAEAELARRGLLLHKVGHGWTGQVLGYPALDWTPVPKEKQHKAHPFAALRGGERALYLDIPADTNLCYADPAAIDRFARLVVDYARRHPTADYLHIWLADEYNNLCECDACRTERLADQYVRLLNEIDRRLTAEALPTRLVFLLYQELLWPPVRERLRNEDRFVLMFAPISRTFDHSYRWGEAPPDLPPFVRNAVRLPAGLGKNLAFLRAWQAQFAGDGFVYDYPLGRAHYGDFGYLHIARVIHGDIARLRELGLNGYLSCQELRAALPNALPNYLMARALLEPGGAAQVPAVTGEYLAAAYGDGWAAVERLLAELSDCQVCDWLNGQGPRADAGIAARLRRAQALCRRFEPKAAARLQKTGADPLADRFWEKLAFHLAYVQRLAGAMALLAEGRTAEADAAWRAFCGWLCAQEADWQPDVDVYRVLEVTQKYTGFCPKPAKEEP